MIRAHLPLGPTILTALMLPVLIALGLWQVSRIGPKTRFIAAVEAAASADPAPLPAQSDPNAWAYRRVLLTGRFDHASERLLYRASSTRGPGYHVLTPLIRDAGPPVIVDRGWVPEARKDPATRATGQVTGTVRLTGLARPGEEGNWTGRRARLPGGLYSRVDLGELSADLARPVASLFVTADPASVPGGYPVAEQVPLSIPNNHLSYAVQWFFFAATLATIYILYVRHWRRERHDSPVAAGRSRR